MAVSRPVATPVDPQAVASPGACVAVIGLGFVGLPLALSYAMEGSQVLGVDVNLRLIEQLSRGETFHREAYQNRSIREILADHLRSGRFVATADYDRALAAADTVIITVGLPVADDRADDSALREALVDVGRRLRPGHLVILRSTVVPGTTERIARPLLEEHSGLKAGVDFDLAYCPERIAEGRAFEEFRDMPIILAAVTSAGAERARKALSRVTRAEIHLTDDLRAAEMAKVIENVQRDVNIAIVQELAAVCEAAGIDVREVIALANTHRRVHLLDPGPGVGGYCIPNALHYLTPLTRTLAVETPTLQSARRTNRSVPQRIVAKVLQHLAHQGVNPAGARVAILGLAMKDFSNDDRQSPALDVAHGLAAAGLWVRAFDPAVPPDHPYPAASAAEAAAGAHALLILARQEGMDPTAPEVLEALAPGALVVDTRGTFRTPERRAVLSRMGYSLWSL